MASTGRASLLRFELRMAEQAERFGAQLKALREERQWKQRDLVTQMADLGDQSLNTNQLSRYENGGAFPNEVRMARFAEALGVDVADLIAPPVESNGPDLLDALTEAEPASLKRLEDRVASLETTLLARLGAAQTDLEDLLRSQAPPKRGRGDKRS
jgi:transcriptional regulator with XRE-family HTH domain